MEQKTVLIIDDEKGLRDALGTVLEAEGLKVLMAENGERGLELALEEHPDLILLDIVMPAPDGFEVLKRLREDEWGRHANVMLLTVLEDMESVSKAVEQGGYEYLVKTDWTLDEVVDKVKEKLEL